MMPLLLPGIDAIDLPAGVARLRQISKSEGRDPTSIPIHGRVYLGDGCQREVEQAIELGFSHLSIGANRLAHPGRGLEFHLESLCAIKAELDSLIR